MDYFLFLDFLWEFMIRLTSNSTYEQSVGTDYALKALFILNMDGCPNTAMNVFRPSVAIKVFIVHARTSTHIYQIGSLASRCHSFKCQVYSWVFGIYILSTPAVISG